MRAYHYTTLPTLSSIVQNGELWLTDTEFLDDRLELVAYREPLRKAAQEVYGPCSAWPRAIEGAQGQLTAKDHEATNYLDPLSFSCLRHYVLCLCENNNNRHLWCQYACRNGEYGCCIELDVEALKKAINSLEGRRVQCSNPKPVSYSPEDAFSSFCDWFREENQKYNEVINHCPDLREWAGEDINDNLDYLLEWVRPFIKSHQYSSEEEIRFLVRASETIGCDSRQSEFERDSYVKWHCRETSQCPVSPYIAIGFRPYMKDVIQSVTLSPMAFSDPRIRRGVDQLFLHNGLGYPLIKRASCLD